MHELLIAEQFPALTTDVDPYGFIYNLFEFYEEIVTHNQFTKYQNQLPAISDFMMHDDFTGEIDNLASQELFGVDAWYAPRDEDSTNKFWLEYDRQAHMVEIDVAIIMSFYNVSYCIDVNKKSYINFPIKEVW